MGVLHFELFLSAFATILNLHFNLLFLFQKPRVHRARARYADNEDASKVMGLVVLDAGTLGVVWAMIAAIAGVGLAVAATTLVRRARALDALEFDGGYNALAPIIDR